MAGTIDNPISVTDVVCRTLQYSTGETAVFFARNSTAYLEPGVNVDSLTNVAYNIQPGDIFRWDDTSISRVGRYTYKDDSIGLSDNGNITGSALRFEPGKIYTCVNHYTQSFDGNILTQYSFSEAQQEPVVPEEPEEPEQPDEPEPATQEKKYKPLLIAVGQSGAYSTGMVYSPAFDTLEEFGLYIKHSPFTFKPKAKNIITQTWIDEDGDDVYLPQNITYEAYDMEVEFVYMGASGSANQKILDFLDRIEGKWLIVYDTYTGQGRQGVYVEDYDEDPTFRRRGQLDIVIFKVKFRVNDPKTNIVLEEGVAP